MITAILYGIFLPNDTVDGGEIQMVDGLFPLESHLIGGLEHEFYFSHHIGNVIIPTEFHIFQRGRSTNNQTVVFHS